MTYPLIATAAYEFAYKAHASQFYHAPDGDQPYIAHPLRLALRFASDKNQTVALLHDVIEDTPVTLAEVRTNFGEDAANSVDHLSRRPGEDYIHEYIERVRLDRTAYLVKLADLADNMAHCAGVESRKSQFERYAVAQRNLILHPALWIF